MKQTPWDVVRDRVQIAYSDCMNAYRLGLHDTDAVSLSLQYARKHLTEAWEHSPNLKIQQLICAAYNVLRYIEETGDNSAVGLALDVIAYLKSVTLVSPGIDRCPPGTAPPLRGDLNDVADGLGADLVIAEDC